VAGVAVAAALALSACGSDNNSSSSSTSTASAGGATGSAASCPSGTLNAAGSTAQQNAISQFTKDYQQKCTGVTVNYNGNGSGAGVTSFIQKQADFAGSDYALSSTQATQVTTAGRCGTTGKAVNIPAIAGAIAFVYNIPNVTTSLNLSAKNLAAIFDGTITTWNDAAIAKDNPGVTLPSTKIQPFFRSDTSGTSYNASNYLNALGGFATPNKAWPGKAGQGVAKSSGVAAKVKATPGAIGYVEYSYATEDNLTFANVSNAAGSFIKLTQANAATFIAQAKISQSGSDTKLAFDYQYSAADAYPADLVTYEIACGTGNDSTQLPLIKGFLNYVVSNTAQSELTALGYVPLPAPVQSADSTAISSLS
jgi:phosphate transport system substrate-binding protein